MNGPSAYVSRACNAVKRCSHLQELVTCRSRVRFITQGRRDQGGQGGNWTPTFWKDLEGKKSHQITFVIFCPTSPALPLCFSNFPLSLQQRNQTKQKPKKQKLFDLVKLFTGGHCLVQFSGPGKNRTMRNSY